jgi:hypothetical protein
MESSAVHLTGVLYSCGSPDAGSLGHAMEVVQGVKPESFKFNAVVFCQADARATKVQPWQQVVVQWCPIGLIKANSYRNVWLKAGVEPDLPSVASVAMGLASCKNNGYGEFVVYLQ